ncbi:Gfo/Idh/MocA family protein [Flavobacterium agrisoli]|uniref:Gfo/Idh/MocA family oxidoreductase n=1 Tax=Flavobacterium agrisoli TaxID=2793066 RepID=A0A934UJE2_9FLAO|nr:Gfo/Idh/MocA family oxidoreductase [Flavobacterium agrisoli]MBK0369408.1 Gfo/Idh/MocA family oxidoreductase [Flavobacterium agrisoli]
MTELKNKNIRWGIIGCGDVTEKKSGPAYQKTAGFEIVAVMRRDAAKAEDYAKRHGIKKFYSDADALINDPEVDAVYIATPPDSHKMYALQVAEAGKPCCIEKPLAPNYADCKTIVAAFEDKKIPLFTAYYRRSLPRFLQIKSWLNENKIGEIRHVSWFLSKPASAVDLAKDYNWRTDVQIAPGGYFDDLASHGLDLFAYLFGEFSTVKGISLNQQNLYSAQDAMTACWLHKSGVTGSGSWNFGTHLREDTVSIYGSLGKITFSVFENDPIVLETAKETISLDIEHPENVQLYHVQNMRDDLFGSGQHPSKDASGAHASWVMDKILGVI